MLTYIFYGDHLICSHCCFFTIQSDRVGDGSRSDGRPFMRLSCMRLLHCVAFFCCLWSSFSKKFVTLSLLQANGCTTNVAGSSSSLSSLLMSSGVKPTIHFFFCSLVMVVDFAREAFLLLRFCNGTGENDRRKFHKDLLTRIILLRLCCWTHLAAYFPVPFIRLSPMML